jgi:molecular chaperone GrpE
MAERNDTEQVEQTRQDTRGDQDSVQQQPPANEADLAAQLRAAQEEAAAYKDKFLRERADMENFRKRQARMAEDRIERNKRDLLEKVLEVVDNLDRAMHYQDTMDRDGLQQGLRMVQWQLNEMLKNEGLSPVPTVGERFDPHIHEAIESISSDEHPEGTVVEEVRKGYRIGNDMLRPARVIVSGGSQS